MENFTLTPEMISANSAWNDEVNDSYHPVAIPRDKRERVHASSGVDENLREMKITYAKWVGIVGVIAGFSLAFPEHASRKESTVGVLRTSTPAQEDKKVCVEIVVDDDSAEVELESGSVRVD